MVSFEPKNNAPKLRDYVGKFIYETKTLIMKRDYWDLVKNDLSQGKEYVEVILEHTPMSSIKKTNKVLGCNATKHLTNQYLLKIYRIDPNDDPKFNVDTYLLEDRFDLRPDFSKIVKSATTDTNDNMDLFNESAVMIFKLSPQSDHHINFTQLPKNIQNNYINSFINFIPKSPTVKPDSGCHPDHSD